MQDRNQAAAEQAVQNLDTAVSKLCRRAELADSGVIVIGLRIQELRRLAYLVAWIRELMEVPAVPDGCTRDWAPADAGAEPSITQAVDLAESIGAASWAAHAALMAHHGEEFGRFLEQAVGGGAVTVSPALALSLRNLAIGQMPAGHIGSLRG